MTVPSHESAPLLSTTNGKHSARPRHSAFFGSFSNSWLPGVWDVETLPPSSQQRSQHIVQPRSMRRRLFLILTEPQTSIISAAYFVILVVSIAFINFLMIIQTMEEFQFTPDNCKSCGGSVVYVFDFSDGASENKPDGVDCVCPPEPLPFTNVAVKWLIYFFTVEFVLRLLMFAPPPSERSETTVGFSLQWLGFLFSWGTMFDALAIFPYFVEALTYSNSLISLRLLRLFRVFQVVRLGQYSDSFLSLTTVLGKAIPYLKLLLALLVFGATIFGSLLYWTEKGEWKYFDETATYEYVRLNDQGLEEISPFTSIPSAFWWFTVTATTVGYGDTFPTSTFGKWIAVFAMLAGVLVIAFPVSVFSDLWSKELSRRGAFNNLVEGYDDDDEDASSARPPFTSMRSVVTTASEYNQYDHISTASGPESVVFQEFDHHGSINIDTEDLNAIVAHMNDISESQRQLRSILRKYKQQ